MSTPNPGKPKQRPLNRCPDENSRELSPLHYAVRADAKSHPGEAVAAFGFWDIVKWKRDPDYIHDFKENWVHCMRDPIKAAAQKYDLPPELLAGVAYNEVGGSDPLKPWVYNFRQLWSPLTDPKKTSIPPMSLQLRSAAHALGYDPVCQLYDAVHGSYYNRIITNALLDSLYDPPQAIFIAAKHLSDLRDNGFKGKGATTLAKEEIEVIGSRYNGWVTVKLKPDKSLAKIKGDLSYGKAITRRWDLLTRLLTDTFEPRKEAQRQDDLNIERVTPPTNVYGDPFEGMR
jgi:hypothetical protein